MKFLSNFFLPLCVYRNLGIKDKCLVEGGFLKFLFLNKIEYLPALLLLNSCSVLHTRYLFAVILWLFICRDLDRRGKKSHWWSKLHMYKKSQSIIRTRGQYFESFSTHTYNHTCTCDKILTDKNKTKTHELHSQTKTMFTLIALLLFCVSTETKRIWETSLYILMYQWLCF